MIISIDAETNGLWGNPFAIAAIVYDGEQKEISKFIARLPDSFVTNQWAKDEALPTLTNTPVTHEIYEDMLESFAAFYNSHREAATPLWHMGHVVEAHLFRECVRLGLIGEWDAPYTPIEVSEHLRANGYDPDSVDKYINEKNISVSDYGSTHNPLYDCEAAARVYFSLMEIQQPT